MIDGSVDIVAAIGDEWGEDSPLAMLWTSLSVLAAERDRETSVEFVCDVVVERLGMTAACLVVSSRAGTDVLRYSTGDFGDRLTEIEVTVGEGPVGESLDLASSVFVSDLDAASSLRRWPLFAPLAVDAGARSCFMFPLAVGVVRIGVLALYHLEPGSPGAVDLSKALLFADLLLALMLVELAGPDHPVPTPPGDGFPLVGPEVHQAAGMIAAQLDIDMDDAFARLRARAFADGRRLTDLATDVIERRLRFTTDPDLR